MSTFSEESLVKRLKELNATQQAIETLSLWLMHHRKHHKRIAEVWLKVLLDQEKASKKLTMLYLANDVIQNSRRKGLDFPSSFVEPLGLALENIYTKHPDESKALASIERVISIWKQRKIYDDTVLVNFENHSKTQPSSETTVKATRRKSPLEHATSSPASKKLSLPPSLSDFKKENNNNSNNDFDAELPADFKAPDHGDVIRAILALENAPSADAVIREKIASLPPEVRDASMLEKVQDQITLDQLKKQVDDACALLKTYNDNLDKEILDREKLAKILQDFRRYNDFRINELMKELETYNQKLERAIQVRDEVKRHANKLPDMSKLPNVTQGRLVPLPTAGDLFTK